MAARSTAVTPSSGAAALNIALGSDSANWSNDFDLFRQANLAMLATAAARRGPHLPDGRGRPAHGYAWWCAGRGLEIASGRCEVGKRADVVIHTLDRPEMRANDTTWCAT